MTINNDYNAAQELLDIRKGIAMLLDQASGVLRDVERSGERNAAEAYWMAHIKCALGDMGYSTHATTMIDTINSLSDGEEGICCECGEDCLTYQDELCADCK